MNASVAPMDELDRVEAIRGLHQDLIALAENQLPTIDKLCTDLSAHIASFQKLLDKPPKSDTSRKAVRSGKEPMWIPP